MKPLVIILGLACVGLAAQLFLRSNRGQQAEKDLALASTHLSSLSNEVAETRTKLEEEARQRKVEEEEKARRQSAPGQRPQQPQPEQRQPIPV